ncbi:MAG TPA: EamA family transporter [Candidatus Aphodousia faecipullorum]|nr:EamA family transporter [Candidatus Aphodousia faecipullorum]
MRSSFGFLGIALAASAAILWGSAGTAQSFIEGELSPYWVGALRLFFAVCFFWPLLCLNHKKSTAASASSIAVPYPVLVLMAGLAMAFFNLGFFNSVKIAGIALGSCTIIGSAPVWAGVIETIVYKKRPNRMWLIGIVIAVAGGVLMAVAQAQSVTVNPFGLLLCVITGFCYASYSLLAKELVKITTPLRATTHTFSVAVLVAAPAAFIASGMPSVDLHDALIVLYLGVVVTGVAYLLYGTALKTTSVSTCVALGLLEPVTAFILAIVVVGEAVNAGACLGLVAILGGLYFVLRSEQAPVGAKVKTVAQNA